MTSVVSIDPVVREAWHPVALSSDLAVGALRAVALPGEDVVIWRGAEGVHA